MKEFGSYFGIELQYGKEFFTEGDYNIYRANCARSAIVIALRNESIKKVYLPYYNCEYVEDFLEKEGIEKVHYSLNSRLLPNVESIEDGTCILIINYWGLQKQKEIETECKRFKNVIIDNSQAFFSDPIERQGIYNVYSPRKFFGVSDGAYLIWKGDNYIDDDRYDSDSSWRRAHYLLKTVEVGTNDAYEDYLKSEEELNIKVMNMSPLTMRILSSIDYSRLREIRQNNLREINRLLGDINELPLEIVDAPLMCYPFYVEFDGLRQSLVEKHIYVSQWWKHVLDKVSYDSIEWKLSKWLCPLPIDHRYDQNDMRTIASIVRSVIENEY